MPQPKIWYQQIVDYTEYSCYDIIMCFSSFLAGVAIDWFYHLRASYAETDRTLTPDALKMEFLKQYASSLLPDATVARHRLYNDKIQMVHFPDFVSYELAYRDVMRDAGNMSVFDKVQCFLRGLHKTLYVKCALQADNTEWKDVESMIAYTRGEVARNLSLRTRDVSAVTPRVAVVEPRTNVDTRTPATKRPFSHTRPVQTGGRVSHSDPAWQVQVRDAAKNRPPGGPFKSPGVPFTAAELAIMKTEVFCAHCKFDKHTMEACGHASRSAFPDKGRKPSFMK